MLTYIFTLYDKNDTKINEDDTFILSYFTIGHNNSKSYKSNYSVSPMSYFEIIAKCTCYSREISLRV